MRGLAYLDFAALRDNLTRLRGIEQREGVYATASALLMTFGKDDVREKVRARVDALGGDGKRSAAPPVDRQEFHRRMMGKVLKRREVEAVVNNYLKQREDQTQ